MASLHKNKRIRIWEKYGRKCVYCGKSLDYSELSIDHIIPQKIMQPGYSHVLVPACKQCNNAKGHTVSPRGIASKIGIKRYKPTEEVNHCLQFLYDNKDKPFKAKYNYVASILGI